MMSPTDNSYKRPGMPTAAPSKIVVRRKKHFLDARLFYFTILILACTAFSWFGNSTRVLTPSGVQQMNGEVTSPKWMRDYANDLAARGLWGKAVEAYEIAARLPEIDSTTRANLHFRIAELCRERIGDYEKAIAHYIRVKYEDKASPRCIEAGSRIVACLDALGRSGDAQRTLDRISALKPKKNDDGDPIVARVGVHSFTRRDLEEAIKALPSKIQDRFAGKSGRLRFLQEGLLAPELLASAALRAGLNKERDIQRRLGDAKRGILGQAFLQRELAKVPEPTEDDLKLFHKANNDLYQGKKREQKDLKKMLLPLKDCRERVHRDWRNWKQSGMRKALFKRLLQAQDVEVHPEAIPADAAPEHGTQGKEGSR